jgi:hypothetical protein
MIMATVSGIFSVLLFVLQFIRFLRRTEGIEAARKYFLEARKLPSCTYHVYVAYATMSFCLDKDAKVVNLMTYVHTLFPLPSTVSLNLWNFVPGNLSS